MATENSLTDRLRAGDRAALREVYTTYREAFLVFGRRFHLAPEELLDIYQDAVIALFQNFAQRQVVLKQGGLKTYLFGIAKFKAYDRHRELARTAPLSEDDRLAAAEHPPEEEPTEEQRLLTLHFAQLSASCQEILRLFYYRNWTIKEIVAATDYKNENTVKAHKSRCMKTLSDRIKNR